MLTGITLAWVVVAFCTPEVASADPGQTLRDQYIELVNRDGKADNPLPFKLSSDHDENHASARIGYLLDGVSIDTLAKRLGQPAEWCEFIPLHLNVKGCTYLQQQGQWYLRFYLGVKEYTDLEDARLLELKFLTDTNGEVFMVDLYADQGPLRSSNIHFGLRAIPIKDKHHDGVYIAFDMSSTPGLAESLASIYLSTIARNKVGFSITGKTRRGKPKYVRGQRAGLERNLVRYLLAIQVYFSSPGLADDPSGYRKRAERWYDATNRYARQLYEISRNEYLSAKLRERANQMALQQKLLN